MNCRLTAWRPGMSSGAFPSFCSWRYVMAAAHSPSTLKTLSFVVLGVLFFALGLSTAVPGDELVKPSQATRAHMSPKRGNKREVEISFLDESKIKITLNEDRVELTNPY